jgi:hypothetical protein
VVWSGKMSAWNFIKQPRQSIRSCLNKVFDELAG